MKSFSVFFGVLFCLPYICFSQDELSLSEAVQILKAQNLSLEVIEYQRIVAENNQSFLTRGLLPSLQLNGGSNYSLNNIHTEYRNLPEIDINGAGSLSSNVGLTSSYSLYNGGARKLNNERNQQLLETASLNSYQLEEDLVFALSQLYYQIGKAEKGLEVVKESYAISKNRFDRVSYAFEYGQGSSIDVLNAQVDINRDSLNIQVLYQQISNLKIEFNNLLQRDAKSSFKVEQNVELSEFEDFNAFAEESIKQNTSISILDQNIRTAQIDDRLVNSILMPNLDFQVGYNYNLVDNNEEAFVTFQRSNGLQAGVQLFWNIFDGGATRIQKQNTALQISSLATQKSQVEQRLKADISALWNSYQTNLLIVKNEEINIDIALQNFKRSEELFNNGQISSVEFRQAQLNQLSSQLNYFNALYDAKINEVELGYLAGRILK